MKKTAYILVTFKALQGSNHIEPGPHSASHMILAIIPFSINLLCSNMTYENTIIVSIVPVVTTLHFIGSSRQIVELLFLTSTDSPINYRQWALLMYLTKLASIQLVLWRMLEQHNEDPAPVFKQVKLDPSLMYIAGERYSLIKIAELWKEMERRIKEPCFGLSAATCWHPTNFGTMGYALLTSGSLRITLERLVRFHRVISDAVFATIEEDKEQNALSFILNSEQEEQTRGREDAALAWILSVLRVNYQKDLCPVSVYLTHP